MKSLISTLLLSMVVFAAPVPVIFDTDMGNDIDDALALALLHALESRGEAKLLAVTITKENPWAAPYVDLVNKFYRRGEIPIGMARPGRTPKSSPMIERPAQRKNPDGSFVYKRSIDQGSNAPDAVSVLRRALQGQQDGSVVIVQVGFSTNLAKLLESPPDAELVRKKVRLLSLMAGAFPSGKPEFNVKEDIHSARQLFEKWPTPIVASGYEIGNALLFPAVSIERDFNYAKDHPVAEAYRAYMKMPYDRPTWDLTSALYAVRPDRGYFALSPTGRITVGSDGRTSFAASVEGRHRYLVLQPDQKAKTLEAMVILASEPPRAQ